MCVCVHTHILTHPHSQPRPIFSFWQTSLRDSRQISKLLLKNPLCYLPDIVAIKAEIVHRNNNAEKSSIQLTKKSQTDLYVQPVYSEMWLIYNFVLVSCIWQSDTDTHTHTHTHTHIYGFPGGSGNYILIHISVTVLKKECVCSKIYLLEKKNIYITWWLR